MDSREAEGPEAVSPRVFPSFFASTGVDKGDGAGVRLGISGMLEAPTGTRERPGIPGAVIGRLSVAEDCAKPAEE
jgi:hypothetical protein